MKTIITVLLFLIAPIAGSAQSNKSATAQDQTAGTASGPVKAQVEGYVFIAPIVSNTQYVFNPAYNGVVFIGNPPLPADLFFRRHSGVNLGFGGEVIYKPGVGFNVEAGYAAPNWRFDGGSALGIISADVDYHFFHRRKPRCLDPFAVGGYSLYYGDRTATQSGFNFGGGLNFWFSKHVALRLEVRDQDHIERFHSQFTRFAAFRCGLTFK